MTLELRIWVRIRLRAVLEIIDYLKARSIALHHEARNQPDPIKSLDLRVQADDRDEDAEEMKAAIDQRLRRPP